ncbi:TPA: PP2C family serine/threonine-protein phosphatase [Serratia marcescens]
MTQKSYEMLLRQLHSWLHRKTINTAVRRVANLPVAIATDIGLVRDENQDRISVMRYRAKGSSKDTVVIALADGMGGMVGGANAASLAISSFFSEIIRCSHLSLGDCVSNAIKFANEAVYSLYSGSGGSTLSVIIIDDSDIIKGVNVGDSRIYEIFDGVIKQLSDDDTIAAIAQKYKNEELNLETRFSNELVQFIGQEGDIEPHFITILREKGKKVILTSDGAHKIGNANMFRLATNAINSGVYTKRVTDLANWFGGGDNASIAVYDVYESFMLTAPNEENVISIWDAFGELQIVNIIDDTTSSGEIKLKASDDLNIEGAKVISTDKVKKNRPRSRRKPKEGANYTAKNRDIKSDDENIEKHQLDISFNNNQEGKDE